MSVIIFFIILSVLVIVHELGHFSVARFFGIRVDEFGLGYPPKARKLFNWRGTEFTLNWLPFGGFVKIFGEDPGEYSPRKDLGEPLGLSSGAENFQDKNRGIQALVLSAGVICNFLFAWLIISIGLMTGLPAPLGLSVPIENPQTVVTLVVPGSPADLAGLKVGDTILSLSRGNVSVPSETASGALTPQDASAYISSSALPLTFRVKRGEEVRELSVTPSLDLLPEKPAVGISMETIGTVTLSPMRAVIEGGRITWGLTMATVSALSHFILQAVTGSADLSSITGPVGLASMVGDARELGLGYLLSFTALISINLAVLNLVPFPALDGGRLLFVALEAVTRRRIPPQIFNALNTAGFAILIFLMLLVTFHDVRAIL